MVVGHEIVVKFNCLAFFSQEEGINALRGGPWNCKKNILSPVYAFVYISCFTTSKFVSMPPPVIRFVSNFFLILTAYYAAKSMYAATNAATKINLSILK